MIYWIPLIHAVGDEQDPLVDCKMIPKSSSEEAFSEDPPQSSIKPAKRTRKTTKKKPVSFILNRLDFVEMRLFKALNCFL